ncbi:MULTISPECIES: hypothetical protein [unclassified Mesorhizobium]|uniref:hypothetical protein n=1 Tax=unclassified Mesorhizobium TaxID=325217 RepID=UPI0016782B42|nr:MULTISPECIES: hypothetical protein [unclassified Mesorhizobium]
MSIKHLWIIGAMLLAAGCTSTGTHGNRDYARNCGNAMDELLLCNGSYVSPHEF